VVVEKSGCKVKQFLRVIRGFPHKRSAVGGEPAFPCLPTCLPMPFLRCHRGNLQSGSSSFHLSKKKYCSPLCVVCNVLMNEAGPTLLRELGGWSKLAYSPAKDVTGTVENYLNRLKSFA
jgi:hypothetical protein